jgi:hypothetical protein
MLCGGYCVLHAETINWFEIIQYGSPKPHVAIGALGGYFKNLDVIIIFNIIFNYSPLQSFDLTLFKLV